MSITVGMADFRAALGAVKVHACNDPEVPALTRVRLTIADEHLIVSATDRFTGAIAAVSLEEAPPKGVAGSVVELLPADVASIRAIHKPGKEEGETPEYLVRIEIGTKLATVTDCSGMLDGRSLRVPILPRQDALDQLPILLAQTLGSEPVLLEDMTFGGTFVQRFTTAASTYHEPLVFESRAGHRSILIRCGEAFLGLLMPRTPDEDEITRRKEWATSWDYRLVGMLTERTTP